ADVISRLNAAFTKALKDPDVAEKIKTLGAEPAPNSPEEFGRFIQNESTKWGKLINEAGIKAN
ncbi:tripartite tricarboxylate transporter substrate-binding protein, partial [uncultured Bradyrhizobium sp.]|uniref:tripartite tricarboxylate transporter substrate-binding protein n=1 Tax=uncultured Bradyrhizobium sp. TaxID=199684 RepID=UPI002626C712